MATSSRFAQDNCPDILYELDVLESEKRDLESLIKSHRQHNQVAGYFGALLILPALAVEHDKEAKARLDEIQRRQDELRAVAGRKECLPATSLTW
ncbi:MAG: hypothetical protein U9Q81_17700 [Pseudomonadota bacterium]|nr:hypothetical protein [Pseudomonadota bacterium]